MPFCTGFLPQNNALFLAYFYLFARLFGNRAKMENFRFSKRPNLALGIFSI